MIKELKRKLLINTASFLGGGLLRFIYFTCKKRFHGADIPETPCVVAFWHGELLMLPFCYIAKVPKGKMIASIISEHKDGEIIARIIKSLGGDYVRGSSRRGAVKALRTALEKIKEGKDIGVTPDGPKGPRHGVADGAVVMAQKSNIPVVTMNCKPTKYWQFNSWDKMFLPKPFSTLDFYVSEPFMLTDMSMEEAKETLKKRLMENAF